MINLNQGIHLKTDHSKTSLRKKTKELDSVPCAHLPLTSNKNERWILACASSQIRDYTFLLWLFPWRGSSILFVSCLGSGSQNISTSVRHRDRQRFGFFADSYFGDQCFAWFRWQWVLQHLAFVKRKSRAPRPLPQPMLWFLMQNTLLECSAALFVLPSQKLSTKRDVTASIRVHAGNEENDKQFHVQHMHL